MNFNNTVKRLLRESKFLNPYEDFVEEFKWYQNKGLFKGDIDLKQKFNSGKIKPSYPGTLDNVSNCYTGLINKKTENERFEQFVSIYLKEDRAGWDRANTSEGKRGYLKKLVNGVKIGKNIDPPIVVNVPGVGGLMVGGRTRAAAAKVANVPINVKFIEMSREDIQDINTVKQTFNSLKI